MVIDPASPGRAARVRNPYSPPAEATTTSADSFLPTAAAAAEVATSRPLLRRAAVAAFVMAAGAIAGHAADEPLGRCWTQGEVVAGPCSDRFAQLGEQGQQLYRSMPLGLKNWFDDNVNGKAGPLGIVNKRDAFINGRWAGFNVFDFVNGRLDKKLNATVKAPKIEVKGERPLSAEEIQRGKEINETCRQMTPQQRQAFVDMLDLDTGRKK